MYSGLQLATAVLGHSTLWLATCTADWVGISYILFTPCIYTVEMWGFLSPFRALHTQETRGVNELISSVLFLHDENGNNLCSICIILNECQ